MHMKRFIYRNISNWAGLRTRVFFIMCNASEQSTTRPCGGMQVAYFIYFICNDSPIDASLFIMVYIIYMKCVLKSLNEAPVGAIFGVMNSAKLSCLSVSNFRENLFFARVPSGEISNIAACASLSHL